MLINSTSISVRFTAAMIGIIFLIIAAFVAFSVAYQFRMLERELQDSLTVAAEVGNISLSTPLWQMNDEFIDHFLQALLLDKRLVWASVLVNDETIAQKASAEMAGKSWEFFQANDDFQTHFASIFYEGKIIGQIRLAASRQVMKAKLENAMKFVIVLGGVLFLAIALTSIVVTRQQIVRPLAALIRLASKISDGELDEAAKESLFRSPDNELGRLTKEFYRMTMSLQSMSAVATRIAAGDLEQTVEPRSPQDVLGNAFSRMLAYLRQMGRVATAIAQGDLREQVEARGPEDCIGQAFSAMTRGLALLITTIRTGAEYLTSISHVVLNSSSKSTRILEEISQQAQDTSVAMRDVSASGSEVNANMQTFTSSVQDTIQFIEQMGMSISRVANHSKKLSQFTDNATTTMTRVTASLDRVAAQAKQSRALSETTMQDAAVGHDSVAQMIVSTSAMAQTTEHISQVMRRLGTHSGEISSIVDVINEVAEQTALLALNASIIASQAGSHGKGFSIVADEIKELAVRVRASTKEITKIIKGVQQEVGVAAKTIQQAQEEMRRGVVLAEKADVALQKIQESAGNSAKFAIEIDTLVDEQARAQTRMISEISEVSGMTQQIDAAIVEQQTRTTDLAVIMASLQDLEAHVASEIKAQQEKTYQVTASMERVLSLVYDHSLTIHELVASANELTCQAAALKGHVETFQLPGEETLSQKKTAIIPRADAAEIARRRP